MKKVLFGCLLSLLALSAVRAQNKAVTLPAAYYVDSQQIDFQKVYVNPQNISNINVQNGLSADKKTNGQVYISLKTPYTSFLTLADITRKQGDIKEKKILYIIDNNVVTDTAGVRIDPSFELVVHAVNTDSIAYLGGGQEKMGVVVIETKKPDEPGKPVIHLRGTGPVALN